MCFLSHNGLHASCNFDAMNRTVIERQQLYSLIEERFREHRRVAGCQVCKTPFPFYCDSTDGANWRVAVLPACERHCRKTLAGIVEDMAQKYELAAPLWRTYQRQQVQAVATGD
jgi:hypothetical protein